MVVYPWNPVGPTLLPKIKGVAGKLDQARLVMFVKLIGVKRTWMKCKGAQSKRKRLGTSRAAFQTGGRLGWANIGLGRFEKGGEKG